MLASSHWRELPASLQAAISDVDGRGTDLGVFLEAADLLVLRDGAALVGVIPPQHQWPSEGDRQQALRNGDRLSLPRLLLLERWDVLDWRKPDVRSLPVAISWRERRVDGLPIDGEDASKQEPPLHPWIYRTASLTAAGPGGSGMHLTTEALMADPQSTTGWRRQRLDQRHYSGIQQLPAIWYASHGAAFGEGELPHLGLAHQYLNHFRCQSDYQELLYRTALPVGVRTGVAEPLGSSTGASQQEPWCSGPTRCWICRRAPRTATEISMAASQAYALLQSQAIQKASMFSSLLQHWCAITGEPLPVQEGPALLVEISPLAPSPKPQPTVSEMLQLQERGIISEVALQQWLGDLAGIAPATA